MSDRLVKLTIIATDDRCGDEDGPCPQFKWWRIERKAFCRIFERGVGLSADPEDMGRERGPYYRHDECRYAEARAAPEARNPNLCTERR